MPDIIQEYKYLVVILDEHLKFTHWDNTIGELGGQV